MVEEKGGKREGRRGMGLTEWKRKGEENDSLDKGRDRKGKGHLKRWIEGKKQGKRKRWKGERVNKKGSRRGSGV